MTIHPRLVEKLETICTRSTEAGVSDHSAQLHQSSHTSTIPVILYYCKPRDEVRQCILRRYGPIKYELPFINAMALDLPPEKIKLIAKERMVQWITEDVAVSKIEESRAIDGTLTRLATSAKSQWLPPMEMGPRWVPEGRRPWRPISVAVIDTGVALHPELLWPTNRIRAFCDLLDHRTEPYDDDGHGTHIAGIIAGLAEIPQADGRTGQRMIFSPRSPDILAIKALDGEGNGNASDILAAMQWILNHRRHYQIQVVNLSLGVKAEHDPDSDPLVRGVEALVRHGITVVAAAGNSGPKQGTISSPGISDSVITVGAVDTTTRPPRVASFSSRGPTPQGLEKPDLLAPGVDILSLDASTALLISEQPDRATVRERIAASTPFDLRYRFVAGNPSGYIAQSGTSMAAPFVSRAAALLCQRFPGIDPATVKRILLSQARPLKDTPPEAQGRGILFP